MPHRSLLRSTSLLIKRRFFVCILLTAATLFVLSCGPGNDPNSGVYPPNDQIIDPSFIFDESNDLVIAYQLNPGQGPVTYIRKFNQDKKMLWSRALDVRQPEPQTLKNKKPSFTDIISDKQGNVIITWNYQNQIFAKKLDANGQLVWKSEYFRIGDCGQNLFWKTLNNPLGITIIWTDANNNLNFQILDKDGNLLFPDSSPIEGVIGFDAISDDEGNTLIIWGQAFNETIRLIKLNSQGQTAWRQAVELHPGLSTPSKSVYRNKYSFWLIKSSPGNTIVGWANNWKGEGINIQKVDPDGNTLWSGNNLHTGNSFGLEYCLTEDTNGGVFVFWKSGQSTFAQHINTNGNALWDQHGLEINNASVNQVVSASSDNAGGSIIIWKYLTNKGYIFRAQHLDENVTKLWDKDNILISEPFSAYMNLGPRIVCQKLKSTSVESSSFFISYGALGGSYIQKVENDGSLPWGLEGLRLGP